MRGLLFISRPRRARRGAMLLMVAISLVLLLGVAALSVDGGRMFQERRNAQAAADAAAEAAGLELYSKYPQNHGVDLDGAARAVALSVAAANGYGADPHSTVTVNIPPKSGAFAGLYGYAEVLIGSTLQRSFSGVFGSSLVTANGRAVGAGTMLPSKAAVMVLDPKRKEALKLHDRWSMLNVGGDLVVNSKDKHAVKLDKKSQIVADEMLVSGGIDKKSKQNIDAEVHTGVEASPDPWASLPDPDKGPKQTVDDSGPSPNKGKIYNLEPGTYKELKFDKGDVVTMAPGEYYVEGETSFHGDSSLVANGVMIYGAGKKGFKFDTTGSVTITPPTSGTYAGISLFQSRDSKAKVEFRKDSSLDIEGVIYAPNSEVKFDKITADISGSVPDEDWEAEEADPPPDDSTDDPAPASQAAVNAGIVSRKLTIGKGATVRIQGANIAARRPLRGIVE